MSKYGILFLIEPTPSATKYIWYEMTRKSVLIWRALILKCINAHNNIVFRFKMSHLIRHLRHTIPKNWCTGRKDYATVRSQWETALHCTSFYHWLHTSLRRQRYRHNICPIFNSSFGGRGHFTNALLNTMSLEIKFDSR